MGEIRGWWIDGRAVADLGDLSGSKTKTMTTTNLYITNSYLFRKGGVGEADLRR